MRKIIIAGSRTFNDFELVEKYVKHHLKQLNLHHDEVEIVSGTARGADQLGEQFAKKYNCVLKRFPADWDKYGKSAGYIRNAEMAKYADILFAFWDGKSAGTRHMIDLAKKQGLTVYVAEV